MLYVFPLLIGFDCRCWPTGGDRFSRYSAGISWEKSALFLFLKTISVKFEEEKMPYNICSNENERLALFWGVVLRCRVCFVAFDFYSQAVVSSFKVSFQKNIV